MVCEVLNFTLSHESSTNCVLYIPMTNRLFNLEMLSCVSLMCTGWNACSGFLILCHINCAGSVFKRKNNRFVQSNNCFFGICAYSKIVI
jgi:hypothetical protein